MYRDVSRQFLFLRVFVETIRTFVGFVGVPMRQHVTPQAFLPRRLEHTNRTLVNFPELVAWNRRHVLVQTGLPPGLERTIRALVRVDFVLALVTQRVLE
jgi:hypothetical protein